jgi:hypothetical protein
VVIDAGNGKSFESDGNPGPEIAPGLKTDTNTQNLSDNLSLSEKVILVNCLTTLGRMSTWGRVYPAIEIAATKFTKSACAGLFLAAGGWLRALVGAVLTAVAPKLTCTLLFPQ